ncbi:energy-coupled thiamine transporter ThiT [Laceyella sacchari]|jgi:thiamine transporter|uniref:Thiamine transporter n=1 Tax=Laceyella tengchongensis TaxID=574699 RepID=A0AA46AE38_9BACL|nr:energy-coupled thiamine transporter ThiT [Laceyella tengchongensis]AUS09291.1 energy-coupled thiamine transporter ThiT [Laceyella sacchari]MRG28972.1 energy-coupled thiamine transporter ThiT [Laceyella tengchongensis]SMP10090.1 thiamine transporter [Laceyella tengchongensis]
MRQGQRLVSMVEVAIMAAIAIVFNHMTPFQLWPNGGSITLSMVPIVAVAFRRGVKPGLVCGLLTGALLIALGGTVVHPAQAALDYPIAFAAVGLAGWVRLSEGRSRQQQLWLIGLGVLVAGGIRYLAHVASGVVFFSEYAGNQPVLLYSLGYNATFMVPEVLITLAVCGGVYWTAPQLLWRRERRG